MTAFLIETKSVLFIHGFLGGGWSLFFFAKGFKKKGWNTFNWEYQGREKRIEEHAENLALQLQKSFFTPPVYYVAHSMGSLVLRGALNHPRCPTWAKEGKAVLLAPPNKGASLGRLLAKFELAKKVAKEYAGKQLMTETDFPHLGEFPLTLDVFVIAGNFGINPFIQGENDGVVAVKETQLNTPHKRIVLKKGHNSLLLSRQAFKLTEQFFKGSHEQSF